MRNRQHAPWAGILLFGLTITTLAQGTNPPQAEAAAQQVQSLVQLGAGALAIDDAAEARRVFSQLLELALKNNRVDLVWQAQHGLGRAAIAAHDPLMAIEHLERSAAAFEQSGNKSATTPYRSLTTALMMQSSSPSDQFVERAFEAAARARAGQTAGLPSRAELAAALTAGDMVVAVLVGDRHAHAWAFDRSTFIGYPLPSPPEITTAVERVTGYASQQDRAGVQRIADDLMPTLLGPVMDRLSTLKRVILVMDGPLQQLSIAELPLGAGASGGSQALFVTVDDASLLDEMRRPPSNPRTARWGLPVGTLVASLVAVALLIVAGIALIRRRSSIP